MVYAVTMGNSNRLGRVIARAGISKSALARAVGCSPAFAWMLCEGTKRPGLALALRIERFTASLPEGPVAPSEWCDLAELAVEEHAAA